MVRKLHFDLPLTFLRNIFSLIRNKLCWLKRIAVRNRSTRRLVSQCPFHGIKSFPKTKRAKPFRFRPFYNCCLKLNYGLLGLRNASQIATAVPAAIAATAIQMPPLVPAARGLRLFCPLPLSLSRLTLYADDASTTCSTPFTATSKSPLVLPI